MIQRRSATISLVSLTAIVAGVIMVVEAGRATVDRSEGDVEVLPDTPRWLFGLAAEE